jgi:hypothetical protein
MVYSGGFEHNLVEPPPPSGREGWDIVVGIDPGLRNAAMVWVGFDNDQRGVVFDEVLLQDRTPADYAKAIEQTNAKWGIREPLYVIDPSARNRSLTNRESVQGELTGWDVPTVPGRTTCRPASSTSAGGCSTGCCSCRAECRGLAG